MNPYLKMIQQSMEAISPKYDPRLPVLEFVHVQEVIDQYVGAQATDVSLAEGLKSRCAVTGRSSKVNLYLKHPDRWHLALELKLGSPDGFPAELTKTDFHGGEEEIVYCEQLNQLRQALRNWLKDEDVWMMIRYAKDNARRL